MKLYLKLVLFEFATTLLELRTSVKFAIYILQRKNKGLLSNLEAGAGCFQYSDRDKIELGLMRVLRGGFEG